VKYSLNILLGIFFVHVSYAGKAGTCDTCNCDKVTRVYNATVFFVCLFNSLDPLGALTLGRDTRA
jgi:hypothetical protein